VKECTVRTKVLRMICARTVVRLAALLILLLSIFVVRDLRSSFCKLDPASLTEEALNDRAAKKAAVE
jgi:hypothetical protein